MNIIPIYDISELDLYASKLNDLDWFNENSFEIKSIPGIKMHIQGDSFDSTVSTTVMRSILKLQDAVYRQYSLFAYGDIRKLSSSERAGLEIYAKVEPGSTWIEVFVEHILMNIAEKIKKMTPGQTMATIAIIAVAATLSLATDKIIDAKVKIKEIESNSNSQKIIAQSQIEIIKAQTEFYREIAKQTNANIEVNGEKIDSREIKEILSTPREKISLEQKLVEGEYKVTDIHIDDEWYSIDVISKDGEVIKNITLLEGMIDQDDYKVIKESANRIFMHMKILLTYKRDIIQCATLNSVEWDK